MNIPHKISDSFSYLDQSSQPSEAVTFDEQIQQFHIELTYAFQKKHIFLNKFHLTDNAASNLKN